MAKARMLHHKISRSIQVNNLSLSARLLFTWMIAHADDEGRLRGEAEYIRATVVPMTKWSFKKIEKHLDEIKKQGLIHYWDKNNESYIEFVKWFDHQHIRKDRFTPSKLLSFLSKSGSYLTTNGQPHDNQEGTQPNITQSNLVESNKSEINEANVANNSYKKEGYRINPYRFEPSTAGEVAALDTWKKLEPHNPFAFGSTYLYALKRGLPPESFFQFASEIKQDLNIEKPGAVFNKKVEMFLEKNKLTSS